MRVVKAEISATSKNTADIKISNGMREFIVSIKKDNLKIEDIESNDVEVKVYSMVRNCCAACPIYVLESGKNEKDDEEIRLLLMDIMRLVGENLRERL